MSSVSAPSALNRNLVGIIAVTAIGFFVVFLFGFWIPGDIYRWTPDSASYIEAASSFSDGRGLLVSSSLDATDDLTPLVLWPPAYSIFVSFTSNLFGLPEEYGVVFYAILGWALLAPAVFVAARSILPVSLASVTAILATTAPGILALGWRGISDLLCIAISTVSVGLVLWSFKRQSIWLAFAAGVSAGLAYSIRNAAIAVFASVICTYIVTIGIGISHRRKSVAQFAAFCMGSAVLLVPLLTYNMFVHGALQPYEMDPSTVSFVTNFRLGLSSVLYDLSGLKNASHFVAWTWPLTILSLAVIAILALWLLLRILRRSALLSGGPNRTDATVDLTLSLLISFTVANIAVAVVARSLYEWGEPVSYRHATPATWALIVVIFAALREEASQKVSKTLVPTVGALLVIGHLNAMYQGYAEFENFTANEQWRGQLYSDTQLTEADLSLAEDSIIVSDIASVLRIKFKRPVRSIGLQSASAEITRLGETPWYRENPRPISVFLSTGWRGTETITMQTSIIELQALGFEIRESGQNWTMLHTASLLF